MSARSKRRPRAGPAVDHRHARVRRAARAGVDGVDRSQAPGAMVGPGRLHHHDQRVSIFVPGGVWRFVMHGPDGRDYENRITFDEIVKPERIRYHHGGGDDVEPVQFRTTVTFENLAGNRTQAHLARGVPVGRRARARDQGIRRRQGRRADAVAARRLCRRALRLTGTRTRSMEKEHRCRIEDVEIAPRNKPPPDENRQAPHQRRKEDHAGPEPSLRQRAALSVLRRPL